MPNWVSTELKVTGNVETLVKFYKKAQTPKRRKKNESEPFQVLDFNAFIPMPEELDIEKSSACEDGQQLYANNSLENISASKKETLKNLGVDLNSAQAVDAAKLVFDILQPELRVLGMAAARNKEKYGYSDWYDWSIANWGTKWNACDPELIDFRPDTLELERHGGSKKIKIAPGDEIKEGYLHYKFMTAWSPAEPVIAKMSKLFPNLLFEAVFEEEGLQFYYKATFEKGEKVDEEDLSHLLENDDDEADPDSEEHEEYEDGDSE